MMNGSSEIKKTTENMTRMQYLMPFISYYASSSQFEYICLKSIWLYFLIMLFLCSHADDVWRTPVLPVKITIINTDIFNVTIIDFTLLNSTVSVWMEGMREGKVERCLTKYIKTLTVPLTVVRRCEVWVMYSIHSGQSTSSSCNKRFA